MTTKTNTAREFSLVAAVRAIEGPAPTKRVAYRFTKAVKTEPATRPGQQYEWAKTP